MPKGSAAGFRLEALEVSANELGRVLGLSERRVRELRTEGVIPGLDKGRFNLAAAVAAYCAHLRPASGKAAAGGSEGGHALDAARVRLVTAQAVAREMLNDQLRGNSVQSEDLDLVVGGMIGAVRTKALAIPPIATGRLAGIIDPAEMQDVLTELVHDALTDLSRTEIVATVKDRARRRAGRGADDDAADGEAGAAA